MAEKGSTVRKLIAGPLGWIFGIFAIIFVPIFIFFMIRQASLFKFNEQAVIDHITVLLGGGEEGARRMVTENVFTDPLLGSLMLAFVIGMVVALALKTDVPIPVWLVTFIVVVIVFTLGMSSWAIPITIVYLTEAFAAGQAIDVTLWLFLVLFGAAIVFGFGLGWWIGLIARIPKEALDVDSHKRRSRRNSKKHVKIKTRRGR